MKMNLYIIILILSITTIIAIGINKGINKGIKIDIFNIIITFRTFTLFHKILLILRLLNMLEVKL